MEIPLDPFHVTNLIEIKFLHLQIRSLGWSVAIIILLCHCVHGIAAKNQLCEVETGQTNIILDIEESRGNCKWKRPTARPPTE